MGKRIMIVGAGVLQLPAIQAAKAMGYEVIAVDRDSRAPGLAIADFPVVVSTNDIPGVLAAAEQYQPDGVMTLATDLPVRTCAAVGARLGLVTIDPATAVRVTDKGEMRLALAEHNIPIPRFAICRSLRGFLEAITMFDHEFVVKPADNSGSRGVTLVRDRTQARDAYEYSLEHSRSGRVLVEDFMPGTEVSVETFSVDGEVHVLAITDKMTTHAPFFVELGHTIPSRLDETRQQEIRTLAKAAVQALGVRHGPTHTEIMVTPEGPKIVEIGARLGGDCIATHLVPLATGVNLVELTIRHALGESVIWQSLGTGAAAIRYLTPTPGILTEIQGAEEARRVSGVVEVSFVKGLGDRVHAVRNSNDRSGFIIARGETTENAVAACEEAAGCIRMITTPDA